MNQIIADNFFTIAGISKQLQKEHNNKLSIVELPTEIIVHICSFLKLSDIMHSNNSTSGEDDIFPKLEGDIIEISPHLE